MRDRSEFRSLGQAKAYPTKSPAFLMWGKLFWLAQPLLNRRVSRRGFFSLSWVAAIGLVKPYLLAESSSGARCSRRNAASARNGPTRFTRLEMVRDHRQQKNNRDRDA
jgi:hypothetical protein